MILSRFSHVFEVVSERIFFSFRNDMFKKKEKNWVNFKDEYKIENIVIMLMTFMLDIA